MVEWHHQLDGPNSEQALGVGDGQGSLECWSPGVAKSRTRLSDLTELNYFSTDGYWGGFKILTNSHNTVMDFLIFASLWTCLEMLTSSKLLANQPWAFFKGICILRLSLIFMGKFLFKSGDLVGRGGPRGREYKYTYSWFASLLFSHSVVFQSLPPHGLQQARPPCPSPTPGVFSNSCPLSRWCHQTISFSVIPFSSCPWSFPVASLY